MGSKDEIKSSSGITVNKPDIDAQSVDIETPSIIEINSQGLNSI